MTLLLNSSSSGVHSPSNASKVGGATFGARVPRMKYSPVKFRKERDGTIIAFENCGCEAGVSTFRPCRIHQGDVHQAARLRAEARYHGIQVGQIFRTRYPH